MISPSPMQRVGAQFLARVDVAESVRLVVERHLDDVEHGMLRAPGAFDEPRVHFVVNCASIGCPALRPEALTWSQMLDAVQFYPSVPPSQRGGLVMLRGPGELVGATPALLAATALACDPNDTSPAVAASVLIGGALLRQIGRAHV